ncbi:MAG TPA: serine hydrolase [Bacillota bacterium]|nr:serine hydrolase [Bacillota bacterium]
MEKLLRTYIQKHIEKGFFTGAICSVYHQGNVIAECALGNRIEVEKESLMMNKSTIADLASVTKVYTSTLVLRLVSEGKFNLQTKITSLLPEIEYYQQLKKKMKDITVYHLLTHSSGIQAWYPFYSVQNSDFYNILNTHIHINGTNKKVEYSDVNYMILGKIIESITGLTLDKAIEKKVKEPLEMKSLSYGPVSSANVLATEWGNKIEKKMCHKRDLEFEGWRSEKTPIFGEVNDGNCHYYFKGVSGHAGLFGSVKDVIRLGKLYIEGGEWNNKTYINKELIHQSMEANEGNRGLGWEIGSIFPEGVGHTGFTGTSLWVVPERQLVVGLLTNRLHVENPISIQKFRLHLHELIIKELDQ